MKIVKHSKSKAFQKYSIQKIKHSIHEKTSTIAKK